MGKNVLYTLSYYENGSLIISFTIVDSVFILEPSNLNRDKLADIIGHVAVATTLLRPTNVNNLEIK